MYQEAATFPSWEDLWEEVLAAQGDEEYYRDIYEQTVEELRKRARRLSKQEIAVQLKEYEAVCCRL